MLVDYFDIRLILKVFKNFRNRTICTLYHLAFKLFKVEKSTRVDPDNV